MSKIKAVIISFFSLGLIFGFTTPASALQITDRKVIVMEHGAYFKCYHNYNFFETFILGKQDGWKYTANECR